MGRRASALVSLKLVLSCSLKGKLMLNTIGLVFQPVNDEDPLGNRIKGQHSWHIVCTVAHSMRQSSNSEEKPSKIAFYAPLRTIHPSKFRELDSVDYRIFFFVGIRNFNETFFVEC